MERKKKDNLAVLKIKRGVLFVFGLSCFLFPGQNWYLSTSLEYQVPKVRRIELSLPSPASHPVGLAGEDLPFLTAKAVAVMDRDSAVLMFGKNEKTELLPASTVKIMTALVALDYYQFDDILVVGQTKQQGQDMELLAGEKMTAGNLLYGLLVASANDAAQALAQNYPGGKENFIAAMNQKAKELHLSDTYFANPTGLDSDAQESLLLDFSYTTALDLARLTSWALQNVIFRQIVATQTITVSDASGRLRHQLRNINELLGRLPGIRGVKTGWTEEAGECLVGYVEREGRGIVTVILGSEDRFGETVRLIDWTFANHRWEMVTPSI